MHRDEAIYARSDARGGITLTAEEADLVRRIVSRDIRTPWSAEDNARVTALSDRLEAAS